MQDGIVHLIDLPQDSVYLKVSNNLKHRLSRERRRLFNNMGELAKTVGENSSILESFFWQHKTVSLRIFLKLVRLFKIRDYLPDIVWLGGKTRGKGISWPKLPFNFNGRDGGKFVAAVLGDGTFDRSFEVSYFNWCTLKLGEVISASRSIFGEVALIFRNKTRVTFPAIVGKLLYVLGLRPGRKTVTNPSIPQFIMNGNEKCKIGFLKQISDDEGSAQINPPNSYSIRYEFALEIPYEKFYEKEKYVPRLLIDLCRLVKNLGFITTRIYGGRIYKGRKKPRFAISWAFDIQGKTSLERFAKDVGFRIDKKRQKLEWGLSRMKRDSYGQRAEGIVLLKFYEAFKRYGHVTKHELSREIARTERNACEWLSKLNKRGLIEQIGGNSFIGQGYCNFKGKTPARYALSSNGLEVLEKYKHEHRSEDIQIKSCPKFRTAAPYSPWRH